MKATTKFSRYIKYFLNYKTYLFASLQHGHRSLYHFAFMRLQNDRHTVGYFRINFVFLYFVLSLLHKTSNV